jgi:hypothetical protein
MISAQRDTTTLPLKSDNFKALAGETVIRAYPGPEMVSGRIMPGHIFRIVEGNNDGNIQRLGREFISGN